MWNLTFLPDESENGPTTSFRYYDPMDDVCVFGEVAQWTGNPADNKKYGGLGVSVCYDLGVDLFSYAIEDCPYLAPEDKNFELVGVSFGIQGRQVSDDLQLAIFMKGLGVVTTPFDIHANTPKDYIFKELPGYPSSTASGNSIWTIQIQVDSSLNHKIDYDFCLRDFALLVFRK